MRVFAIDPGNEASAAVVYSDAEGLEWWAKLPNDEMLDQVKRGVESHMVDVAAVEMVASYGMAVGATVFETCVWIGRFCEAWRCRGGRLPDLIYRHTVKMHLCHHTRAKDANVRQAIIDRYGGKDKAIGRKASPGPLYGLKADGWQALGVAITAAETAA